MNEQKDRIKPVDPRWWLAFLALAVGLPFALQATPEKPYRWEPFQAVAPPALPPTSHEASRWARQPLDLFVAAEHAARGLHPRPEAAKGFLLRRVYLDVIGLSPTREEQQAFAEDQSPEAYEKVVDRLLNDPGYGERWGRHWMDVWRYSDWAGWADGGQVRDSKPHIWRWRDWIVESLNRDKGYDRMILEMLAADELAPEDPDALRATGFLVRNYKMLSREQWMEDTLKHTSQAFLGVTMGCAKCHDHKHDPISQNEYYQLRAVFEPHQVRTDRVPGQTNTVLDGLVRVYDAEINPRTYLFVRGDERKPDTNRVMQPGVPGALGGSTVLGGKLGEERVTLPPLAARPDKREFVIQDSVRASEQVLAQARGVLEKLREDKSAGREKITEQELQVLVAEAKRVALRAVIQAERSEDDGRKESGEWKRAATEACAAQRQVALAETKLKLHLAGAARAAAQTRLEETAKATNVVAGAKALVGDELSAQSAKQKVALEKTAKELEELGRKFSEAEKVVAAAERECQSAPTTNYQARSTEVYPAVSTGRRLAFARWVASRENPLTARVAMNHIWLRHFGRGIVPTPADFGRNGRPPSQPQLLDWLAAEFMARNWSMKAMHRMILTSSTYRMASTPDERNARVDPDNVYLWRMPSRRMEAESVRDNLLYVSGNLDPAMGGPEIDHKLGLTSKRRSVYLRIAAEKEVEFLKIFDSPSVTECYERRPSVMPQQALALANSELTLGQARSLAARIAAEAGENPDRFVSLAFARILARPPRKEEVGLCREFLEGKARRLDSERRAPLIPVSRPPVGTLAAVSPNVRARENLVLVLFNHNDFVTIR